jgi:hypothetical protein
VIEISSFLGAQLSMCLHPHLHLRTETDPVSETSCSLEYQTMEKVQNPSNSVCRHLFLGLFNDVTFVCSNGTTGNVTVNDALERTHRP